MGHTLDATGKPTITPTPTQTVADIQAAVTYAEKVGGLLKVTAAQRTSLTSAQTKPGWIIAETDTGSVYLVTPEFPQGFPMFIADTGWELFDLDTNWVVYSGETPQFRVKNGWLAMIGRVTGPAVTANTKIGELPAGATHGRAVPYLTKAHYDGGVCTLQVNGDGGVFCIDPGTGSLRAGVSLTSIVYPVQ